MPRLDLAWGTGIEVRERVWGWRGDVTQQVVNPDIDGLLTACLLHHLKGWPVVGFYDTQRLLLDPSTSLPLNLDATIWVDVDMCWPGARSLSQHVITDRPHDAHVVSAYGETVNPSLLRGHHRTRGYRDKYPFGTFQWAWWLVGGSRLPPPPDPDDLILTGLAWMPDGGFQSVEGVWRDNCVRWATEHMTGSILAPLASTEPHWARAAVEVAAAELRRRSGVDVGWRNHQFTLTRGSGSGPVLNVPADEVPHVLQAICDAICSIYGWSPPQLPGTYAVHEGIWKTGPQPPPEWPSSANRHEVVSLAVTSASQFCWTEPSELTRALEASSRVHP